MAVVRPALLIIAVLGFTPAAEEPAYSLDWVLESNGHIVLTLTYPDPRPQAAGSVVTEPLVITEFQAEFPQPLKGLEPTTAINALLLASFFGGGRDLASTAALDIHAKRLWGGSEAEHLRPALAAEPAEGENLAARRREAERLIALRLAGRHDHLELLPLIRPLAEHDDSVLARAARETMYHLGEGPAPEPPEMAPLAEALVLLPANCDLVAIFEPWRVPTDFDPGLLAARTYGLGPPIMHGITQGNPSPFDVIGDLVSMEVVAEAPASLAALIGNLRIDRLIIAMRFDDPDTFPSFRILIEGDLRPDQASQLLECLPFVGQTPDNLDINTARRLSFGTLPLPQEDGDIFVAAEGGPLSEREHRLLSVWLSGIPPIARDEAQPFLLNLTAIEGQFIVDPDIGCIFELGVSGPADDAEEIERRLESVIRRFRRGRCTFLKSKVELFAPALLPHAGDAEFHRDAGRLDLRLVWTDWDLARWGRSCTDFGDGLDPFGVTQSDDPAMVAIEDILNPTSAP